MQLTKTLSIFLLNRLSIEQELVIILISNNVLNRTRSQIPFGLSIDGSTF